MYTVNNSQPSVNHEVFRSRGKQNLMERDLNEAPIQTADPPPVRLPAPPLCLRGGIGTGTGAVRHGVYLRSRALQLEQL